MEPLVVVLAVILALNLAYGLFIGLLEVRRHRKARREIGALEAMWRLDPRAPQRKERAVRSFRVAGALAASLMLLGGIAVATPGGRGTVSTVTEAIGSLIAAPDGQVAEAPEVTNAPTSREITSAPGAASREIDAGGPVDDDVAPGSGSSTVDDDPVLSPVTGSDPSTGEPDPAAEEPPSGDDGRSPESSPSPTLDPPPTGFTVRIGSVSATSVTLEWEAMASATGYRLERSGGSTGGWTVDLTGTTWTDEGLAPDTAYTYVVTATLEGGSSVEAQATVETAAAPVP